MTTITMTTEFDQAIRSMCTDAVSQAIGSLAEKYGFDQDEAVRHLNLDDLKIARKRGPSPKKADEKSPKSKKETKTKDDKPKTKRAPTGYLLYVGSIRTEVKEAMQAMAEEGVKVKPQEVVTECAARWKTLEQSERDEWITKAKTPETSEGDSE